MFVLDFQYKSRDVRKGNDDNSSSRRSLFLKFKSGFLLLIEKIYLLIFCNKIKFDLAYLIKNPI